MCLLFHFYYVWSSCKKEITWFCVFVCVSVRVCFVCCVCVCVWERESLCFSARERESVVFEHNIITIMLPLIPFRSQIRSMLGGETGKVNERNRVKILDLQWNDSFCVLYTCTLCAVHRYIVCCTLVRCVLYTGTLCAVHLCVVCFTLVRCLLYTGTLCVDNWYDMCCTLVRCVL